jgi:hypothetical protein
MPLARSGLAVGAGFVIFSLLFTVIGPTMGAILTTVASGLIAGYVAAKIAAWRELAHGGATAGLVAASLVFQPVLTLPARMLVATLAVAAITAGAWIRGQARVSAPDMSEAARTEPGPPRDSRDHQDRGGEERS